MQQVRSIHWFRKGLRIHDNPALRAAATGVFPNSKIKVEACLPIFILDPWFVKSNANNIGVNRWQFLIETLQDLDTSLRTHFNSRLLVFRGNPQQVLPALFQKYNISLLTFERDTEPYALQRDAQVVELANKHNVEIYSPSSHTLFDLDELKSSTPPPLQYKSMLTLIKKHTVPLPVHYDNSNNNNNSVYFNNRQAKVMIDSFKKEAFAALPAGMDEEELTKLQPPSKLEELGFDETSEILKQKATSPYKGGETLAIERMYKYLQDKQKVLKFEKPNTRPTAYNPPDTTVLSPYLKFGSLSVRLFYHELQALIEREKATATVTQPPVSLLGQLYWREFFYLNAYLNPGFGKMVENPHCLQIPWRDSNDKEAIKLFEAWQNAKTGYPFIDACMTQLKQEGYLHHLARHAVACFLTRGDLWVTWENGAQVFEKLLLDADPSINFGNWQWLSASCFFHEYFRIYSPVAFPKKTDPEGAYVKHYLPQLKHFPAKYIYEPWKAPRSVQESAKCIIGKDYPMPIVEHESVSKINKDKMKKAYEQKKYGKFDKIKLEQWQKARSTLAGLAKEPYLQDNKLKRKIASISKDKENSEEEELAQ